MLPKLPRRIAVEALIAVLALSLVLVPGCGPHVGRQTVTIKYYADCYRPLQDLRASAEKVKSDTAKGVAVGAAAGALAGLLARGNLQGALVGALIGAAAGGLGTYLISASVQEKALSERLAEYGDAMQTALTDLKNASQAAKLTCECYRKEYDALKSSYGRKTNPTPEERSEMLERITEMRDGNNDAIEILTYYGNVAAENLQTFDAVVAHEETRESDKASSSQIRTVRANRQNYQQASESVQSNLSLAQRQKELFDDEYNVLTQQAGRPAPAAGSRSDR
jgi:predicted lipid-binding transport protein (Tim44 family)